MRLPGGASVKEAGPLRKMVCDGLDEQQECFEPVWDKLDDRGAPCPSWDHYVRKMRGLSAYAGELEALVAAHLLGFTIYVVRPGAPTIKIGTGAKHIWMWLAGEHYEPCHVTSEPWAKNARALHVQAIKPYYQYTTETAPYSREWKLRGGGFLGTPGFVVSDAGGTIQSSKGGTVVSSAKGCGKTKASTAARQTGTGAAVASVAGTVKSRKPACTPAVSGGSPVIISIGKTKASVAGTVKSHWKGACSNSSGALTEDEVTRMGISCVHLRSEIAARSIQEKVALVRRAAVQLPWLCKPTIQADGTFKCDKCGRGGSKLFQLINPQSTASCNKYLMDFRLRKEPPSREGSNVTTVPWSWREGGLFARTLLGKRCKKWKLIREQGLWLSWLGPWLPVGYNSWDGSAKSAAGLPLEGRYHTSLEMGS